MKYLNLTEGFNPKEKKEFFIDLFGYKNIYQISNYGRIKRLSFKRFNFLNKKESIYKEKILKPFLRKGYEAVRLTVGGKSSTYSIHRLVAMNFISTTDLSLQVNHKDGNKINNHVSNLEWCTPKENVTHAIKNNLWVNSSGSKNGMSKLNEGKVIEILTKLKKGEYYRDIAIEYGISHKTISSIKNKTTWKHISI